jgi:hypothetical protein
MAESLQERQQEAEAGRSKMSVIVTVAYFGTDFGERGRLYKQAR